jgi:HEAT repeat protein/beta-lactamase regulating signal transducer with metallopeptidase domain
VSILEMPFAGTGALILFLAKATLLLVAALVATATLKRSTAGARHLVWLTALVGVLALPLLSRIPSLRLGLLPSALATPARTADAPMLADDAPAPVVVSTPTASPVVATTDRSSAVVGGVEGGVSAGVSGGIAGVFPALATTGYSMLSVIAMTWAFVALALVGWLIAGAISVRRIVASARELTSPDWTMPLCEVADRLDLDVPPRIVLSDRIEMAFACRALAPTIVLPASAEAWTDDRRRAVLFHELAHVKRHDLLGHTLGRLACALYWFHPLVWTAAKRLRAESERACDDLVLTCGARPSEYAQHLLDMVTNVRDQGAPIMALPMARKKEFEGRMLAILDPAIRRASPGRLQAAAVIGTLGVLSLTIAAASPATATPAPAQEMSQSKIATEVVERAADRAVSMSVSKAPSPSPSPKPAPNSSLSTTPPSPPSHSNGMAIRVNTGNAELDGFVKDLANVVVSSAGTALQQAGVQLARTGRMQVADTGRVAMLIKILATDSDASVRRTAAWGLHDLESPDVRNALMKSLRSDADDRVREMSAWALGEQGNAVAGPALSDALSKDRNVHVRVTAAWALGETEAKSEISALETAMADSSAQLREVSAWALGRIEDRGSTGALVRGLKDPAKQVRLASAWALGQIEDKSSASGILAAFKTETDADIRSAELRALAVIGEITPELVDEALKSSDPAVRRRAVSLLAGTGSVEPWPWPRPQPRPTP